MINLITILALLFASLFIVVALTERFGKRHSGEELNKLSRWILPLIALIIVLQGLRYMFAG